MAEKGADVRVPPPLLYAAPLAAAAALDRFVPLRMPPWAWRAPVGVALVVTGQALATWGIVTFRRHRTTMVPHHEVSTFVTTGPYAYTRNPMYVGMTTAYLGGSLLVGSWWAPLALPAVVATVDRTVIRHEEAYLRRRFGGAYDDFCRHTRRWV